MEELQGNSEVKKDNNKIELNSEMPGDFNKTYEFFHTFANQSSQKKEIQVQKFKNA